MHEFLSWLRRLRSNDTKTAWTNERAEIQAASKADDRSVWIGLVRKAARRLATVEGAP